MWKDWNNWMSQRGFRAWSIQTGPYTYSPLRQFCFNIFPTFPLSYWWAIYYYPRWLIMGKGNSSNLKTEWDRGFTVPGAFKLDHLQPIERLLFPYFCNFSTFILGSQFLYPRGPIMGKGNSSNLKSGWDRELSVHGAFKLDHLQQFEPILIWIFSYLSTFILGGQFL